MTEEEKLIIKRDIACNIKRIEELRNEFKNREPAKETMMALNNFKIEMAVLKEELKNIARENAEQHKEILSRIGRIEQFIIGLLILFALSAVYFVFNKVGLSIN